MSSQEKYLGEFEHVLLLALIRLAEQAYGTNIRSLLSNVIKRDVSIGALYATLERLENKGLISSFKGESTPERGGRAKRYFEVTAKGKLALKRAKHALTLMWQDVSLSSLC